MREADQAECRAMGVEPYVALARSREMSERSYEVWSPDGALCAEWGWRCRNFLTGQADVWMLSFAPIERRKVWAARVSLLLMDNLLTQYASLRAEVHAQYALSVRWLDWLGFRVEGSFDAPTGEVFLVMVKRRGEWER